MRKYKVLREMPLCKVGDIIESVDTTVSYRDIFHGADAKALISEGWLAEVPEEKYLWEKLYNNDPLSAGATMFWKNKATIARQHFAEVARKVDVNWFLHSDAANVVKRLIIQAIEKDGEK